MQVSKMQVHLQAQLKVVLEVDTDISAGGNRPEGRSELQIVHPDLDVLAIQEKIQTARVVQVQVTNDDLLDILNLVAGRLDLRVQLVLGLVAHAGEDIRQLGTPNCRVVFAGTCLPEDQAFVRVLDQYAVHLKGCQS
jgi:hypothetical protein